MNVGVVPTGWRFERSEERLDRLAILLDAARRAFERGVDDGVGAVDAPQRYDDGVPSSPTTASTPRAVSRSAFSGSRTIAVT